MAHLTRHREGAAFSGPGADSAGQARGVLRRAMTAVLAACSPPIPQVARQRTDMPTTAGFRMIPADTPDREASPAVLPAREFSRQQRDGATVFTHADPLGCNCLYAGDQTAYNRYRQAMRTKNRQAAEERSANIARMDWGA